MAENYVRLETMSLIVKLGPKSTMEDFAWVIANSVELTACLIVRRNEKKWLNKINSSPMARYTIKDPSKPGSKLKRIQLPNQKAFALMMYDLSSACRAMIKREATQDSGPVQGLIRDANTVISKGVQICKCIVRYFEATPGKASALCEALVFSKVLGQKLWPDDPLLITQAKGIGETIASRLISKGNIDSLRQILSTDPRRLEILAEIRPPQGTVMQDNVSRICPVALKVTTRLKERRTTMVADITVTVADAEARHQGPSRASSLSRWCRLIVFSSTSRTLLANRRLRYSAFAKEGGWSVQVDTCSPADPESQIIVRIIDESVLGVDVHSSTPLLPSSEAESILRPAAVPAAKRTPTKISPGTHQSKLNFAVKKRPRITQDVAISLYETGEKKSRGADEGVPEASTAPAPSLAVSQFKTSYKQLMEGFEIFLESPQVTE